MKMSCADLEAYLDETLEGAARERFEEHVLGCESCQARIEDAMQLWAAGAELARSADRPRAAPADELVAPQSRVVPADELAARRRPARRRLVWVAAAIPVLAAAAVLVLWLGRRGPALEERIGAALGPSRALAMRLPYAPLDRHRPYDVSRGAAPSELIPIALTAEVEASRPVAALVAVLLASHDLERAEAILARVGRPGPAGPTEQDREQADALELDRAALAITRDRPAEALTHLDGVLAHAPAHPVALWNRALVLEQLLLPLAAAEAFDAVAKLGEPGWSAEASLRAAALRGSEQPRAARWDAGKAACDAMASGTPIDRAAIRAHADTCRPQLYLEVRRARSRDALLALAPAAEELDAAAGNTAATELVRGAAAADPARRGRAVELYLELTAPPGLPVAEQRARLDELRATGQDDIVLGAIPRTALMPELREEYVRRAQETGDPYYAEVAEEHRALALRAGGEVLRAEVVLRRAVDACQARDVELRCSYLHQALADVYLAMHRAAEARQVTQAGLDRARRLGLYWAERLFLNRLADAARLARSHAIMRAYVREATLRTTDVCDQLRYHHELLAMASVDDLRFEQARRDLDAAPTCKVAPTLERARVTAELARVDGTPAEASVLGAALALSRQRPNRTAGDLAYLDAIEGRLLAARDPAAARPLLRRAIEAADRAERGDADAALARRDAYGSLLVQAGAAGDAGASLALFAEAAGTPPRAGACAVGALVDGERVLVVVRDARGALVQRFEPRGRTGPELDAAALIPTDLVGALGACERVDVLALPPLFGLPGLLPPQLAWSYRGRPAAAAAPPAAQPTIVTVADVVPPPELKLPPLAIQRLAPVPGAVHVDLAGAEATPERLARAMPDADAIEIHAHGFVDQGVSDASLIALSPQTGGRFTLDAREIARLGLRRSPLVILAACHAAYTAPYRHEPWGLPRAFLLAGARAVIASPEVISDAEAGAVFRAIEARILAGTDPAIALRDERARRLAARPDSWVRSILLFD